MNNNLTERKNRIWYMLCFFALGVIDQRRGSAIGNIQMAAANCTGIVVAAMLFPSLEFKAFKHSIYVIWTGIAIVGGWVSCIWGIQNYIYSEQWITGTLNILIWGYLIIYLIREWKITEAERRLRQPFFWAIGMMLLLMQFSLYGGILPLWMLLIFGGFYLIGIPQENRTSFFQGMLNGIIMWFFVQQILAYGFRPYDYARYRGLYSGETQNGLFYMIVYCAFLCKWIWVKKHCKHKLKVWICFFMAAGSISFLLLTGGRSSLGGAAIATILVYFIYDIVRKKSFYGLLVHIVMSGLCVVITFPLVYGTIRYLPTLIHHPIWFEGEYNEMNSIRSFDSWDSDRYISFEEAIDQNLGRILELVGIDLKAWETGAIRRIGLLKVYAAELSEPGRSPENPFVVTEEGGWNFLGRRKGIYVVYFKHLNLLGHSRETPGFYLDSYYQTKHAHNMLLQMAYDYGIIVGILFLGLVGSSICYFLWIAMKGMEDNKWICMVFYVAIFVYSMAEMAIVSGMMTWSMIYLFFYFSGEHSKEIGK